ncbi:MAG: RluA family pseudouridine synthase [Myxococcota bacterium]
MIEFTVNAELAGSRPDQALRSVAPSVGRQLALRLLKESRILVNGRAATLSTQLHAGDTVRAKLDEKWLRPKGGVVTRAEPTEHGFTLLYLDEHLCVVDKPTGMPTHPGVGAPAGSALTDRVREMLVEKGHSPSTAPAAGGRLDRGTSGVVALSISTEAEGALGKAYLSGAVHKEYLVLVQGVTPERFEVSHPLTVARYTPTSGKKKKVKEALTRCEALAHSERATLLRALPVTGRTHQIRRHLRMEGHPVVGDERYALPERTRVHADRLCLHLHRLVLPHPVTGQKLELVAEPPEDFRAAVASAGITGEPWKRQAPRRSTR